MSGSPARAIGDLSGTWTFEITGDFRFPLGLRTLYCTAPIEQNGDQLEGDFDCGIATGNATATITEQTLGATIEADVQLDIDFLGDIDAHAAGTVSPNGNYMEGDWDATGYDGAFVANRNAAPFLNGDLNCDTQVNSVDALTAILHAIDAAVSQHPGCRSVGSQFASAFGDVNCDGTVDQVDALWLLRYEGGIPAAAGGNCPPVGTLITEAG
jgi:hypothetical protein